MHTRVSHGDREAGGSAGIRCRDRSFVSFSPHSRQVEGLCFRRGLRFRLERYMHMEDESTRWWTTLGKRVGLKGLGIETSFFRARLV